MPRSAKQKCVDRRGPAGARRRPEKLVAVDPRSCGLDATMVRDYEGAMAGLVKEKVMPGCASVVFRRGKVVQAGCWGYADAEARTPMRFDSLCRLYCMGKSYIATAFGTLLDDGTLGLDERLDKYLPEFSEMCVKVGKSKKAVPAKRPILLRHLPSHTSGIDYPVDIGETPEGPQAKSYKALQQAVQQGLVGSLKEFCERLSQFPLSCQPGEGYYYGYSFDVLARVLEVVTGKSLLEVLEERVFKPLGMRDTMFAVPKAKLRRLAACYGGPSTWRKLYKGGGRKPVALCDKRVFRIDGTRAADSAYVEGRACKVNSGGGFMGYIGSGLVSTVADTVPFLRMLINRGVAPSGKRLLKASTLEIFEKNRLKKKWGQGKACYIGNNGVFRDGGSEVGMGGAACTYWSLDRKEDVSTIWFTQNVDFPDFSEKGKFGSVDPDKADLWKLLHKAAKKGPGKRPLVASTASHAKRLKNRHPSKSGRATK